LPIHFFLEVLHERGQRRLLLSSGQLLLDRRFGLRQRLVVVPGVVLLTSKM